MTNWGKEGEEEGVRKEEEWGRRCEEGGLVREGLSPCAMCRIGGKPPGPVGESVGTTSDKQAGTCYCHPYPVAIGVDGWRCPKCTLRAKFSNMP